MSPAPFQKKKFAGIASFRMINALRNGIIYSFMGIYLRENLQLSVTESNLLFTLIEVIGALAQTFFWGFIADKYRVRTSLIIIGESVPAIGYLGIYWLHKQILPINGMHIAGLSIVFGFSALEFFWGAGFVGFYTLLADIPDHKTRSKYMGYTVSMMSIGRICGSLIGGLFFDWQYSGGGFGEGLLFFILSPVILGFTMVSVLTRKNTETLGPETERLVDTVQIKHDADPTLTPDQLTPEYDNKHQSVFYWLLAGIILSAIGQGAIEQITLFYIRLPQSIEANSFLISLLSVVLWLGLMISGPFGSRISEQNASFWYLLTIFWFALLPILYPLIGLVPGSILLAFFLFVSRGIAMAIFTIASFSLLTKIIPIKKRGRLLSQYNAGQMMAWGVGGSLVGGPMADWRLSQGASLPNAYLSTFIVAFLFGVLSIIVTLWKARIALKESIESL